MEETENIKAITNFLFIEDDFESLKFADLVIILCNNNINGIAKEFNNLYKSKLISDETTVIISGNHGALDDFDEKECILVCDKLVKDYGYNNNLFILEEKATNIYENLLFSKNLIKNINDYNNIIIIGAAFALRRIKMCASKLEYPLDKIQFVGTVDTEKRNIGKDNWWKNDEAKIRVYQELERIGKYLVKGDLDIK